jgi:hypothetical protein
MKKILLIISVTLSLYSCDDVLDLKPLDKLSETDVWNDPALIRTYVDGCYGSIPHNFREDMLNSACDESYCIHNYGGFQVVQRGELTSDNISSLGGSLNLWNNGYGNIRKINVFFSQIEFAAGDETFKNVVKGEMTFIRAYIYANLIWRYGGVPIITKVFGLNDEDFSISRNSYDECVDFIVAELDNAAGFLPARQPDDQKGRASADACRALKARVLLYAASALNNSAHDNAKWQKAADASEVLLNVGYELQDDYQSVFTEDNGEIIFARYFTQSNSTNFHVWMGRNGSSGWTAHNPTQNLVNAYEMAATGEQPYIENTDGTLILNPASGYDPEHPYEGRDPRFEASILHDGSMWAGRETETYHGGLDSPESATGGWDASKTSYAFKKFMIESIPPSGGSLRQTNPWIFFRYGEILLNYAEAKFELGDEATAREYLNKVRARKSVNMPPVTDSGDQLRKRIQNERRVEFSFEDHRFFDVRRWKIAMETENKPLLAMNIQKLSDGAKTYTIELWLNRSFLEQHYLIPIPRSEIDMSLGSLIQNPEY